MGLTDDIFAKRGTWQLFKTVDGYDLSAADSGHVDKQGRLWLRLPDALVCTDGRHVVKSYELQTGSRRGTERFGGGDRYWAITRELHLLSLSLADGSVEDHTDNLPPLNDAYWLWTSRHEDILIGSPGKLIRYDGQHASVMDVPRSREGAIHSAAISPDGDLWFTSHLGLHAVVGGKAELVKIPGADGVKPWEFFACRNKTLWMPAGAELLHLDCSRGVRVTAIDIGVSLAHTPLLIDDGGNIWITIHFRGTMCLNSSGRVMFPFEDTPGLTWARCMVQDRTRAFWLIGVGNGVIRYDPQMLHVVQRGYLEASVMGEDGKLRVTAASKGLLEYDSGNIRKLCDEIPARCLCLSLSKNNDIYISSPYGLFFFDARQSKVMKSSSIPGLSQMEEPRARSTEWDNEGALIINASRAFYRYASSVLEGFRLNNVDTGRIMHMVKDGEGTFWFAGAPHSPVHQFKGNRLSQFHERLGDWLGTGTAEITGCCADNRGDLWFSTRECLVRFNVQKGTLDRPFTPEGYSTVRHVRVDDRGTLWISMTNGLFVHDGTHTYRMTEAALLPSRRIVATYPAQDDRTLIVTELGLCEYRPNRGIRPEVFISRVVADKAYDAPERLVVPETAPVLRIQLTAVNMKLGPLKYRIRLVGHDDEWVDTWQEQFQYEGLPVGNYRFEAMAIDQDLMTSEGVAAVDIEIVPDTREAHIATLEGELRDARDFAANIIRSINDAIIVLDTDGLVATANDAAVKLLGYEEADLVGKSTEFLFPEPAICFFDAPNMERLRKEGRLQPRELELRGCDGECVTVMFSASCMYDRTGRLQGYIMAASDISEYKRLQSQMLQDQKMESLGVLAGGFAHDFNNLLTVILGNADLVLSELTRESKHYDRIADVVAVSNQATKLCSEMLVYSGRGQNFREALSLTRIVQQNTDLLKSSIPRSVAITYDLDHSLPSVWGDEVQLMQVVLNLVLNAAEAIGDGPGLISLSTCGKEAGSKELESEFFGHSPSPGKYVILEVSDNGCGMDHATLSRIFEPFFTTKFTGRGLGLAAIRGIVKSHGGVIKVNSTLDKGSTFQVYLPAMEVEPGAETEEEISWSPEGETVLVVDDEATVLASTTMLLRHMGLNCVEALDGVNAIEKLRASPDRFDLMLLDVTMPRMSGPETYEQVRQIRPDLPVIVYSGYSEDDIASRFPRGGLLYLLHKPFTLDQLREKVAEAMRGQV